MNPARTPLRAAALAAGIALATPVHAAFMFAVYGDSRAGNDCSGNQVHKGLVRRIVAANPAFVVNTGDMITGYAETTNFVERGACREEASTGSLKELIAPLQKRPPPPGLPTAYFPVIGNHDDNWSTKPPWYPDRFGGGICDVFDMKALVPNHTKKPYYRGGPRRSIGDAEFHDLMCSTREAKVYPHLAYYSFTHEEAHFVVLRINNNNHNLETCRRCTDSSDYSDYYNIHQLDWLAADLAAARANPRVQAIYAFLHSPVFGSGENHPNTPSWKRLGELFTKHGVAAVFSGHSHLYERSVPVAIDEKAPEGARDDARGTVYVTTGGGGAPLHGFRPAPWYVAQRQSVFHYVEVRVDGRKMRVRAVDHNGKVIDTFER